MLGGDKIHIAPVGIFGGWPGSTGTYRIIRATGEEIIPKRKMKHVINNGDIIYNFHPGGGGYGNPLERDPEMVKDDLIDGFISERAAGEDYGVVVDVKTEKVDYEATKKLRAELSKKPRDGYDRHIGGLPSHKIGER